MNYRSIALPALYLTVFALFSFSGCDSSALVETPPTEHLKSVISSSVRSVSVRPVIGKSGKNNFVLKITFDNSDSRLRLPDGINILSRRKGSPNVVIYDDGKKFDAHAGDGVYSGIVPHGCLPRGHKSRIVYGKTLELSCKFEFVGPGEECGGFGECPERVHRSLLWGLIEYETNIIFCVCIVDCELSNN